MRGKTKHAATAYNFAGGCGGDVIRGEQAVAKERHAITEVMEGRKLIVTVAGLGGGVATGGCRTIASVARALKIPALFLLVTPLLVVHLARVRRGVGRQLDSQLRFISLTTLLLVLLCGFGQLFGN